jgi:hypothetical protein
LSAIPLLGISICPSGSVFITCIAGITRNRSKLASVG